MDQEEKQLYYPNELTGFKLASEMPDVRGWEVKDLDKKNIGKVDDLLVNKDLEQVVYLDVKVDDSILLDTKNAGMNDRKEFINEEGEDHLLIPIGMVNIAEDEKEIYTAEIGYPTFAQAKRRKKEAPIERKYEETLLKSYDTQASPTIQNRADRAYSSNFYNRREFDRDVPFRFQVMKGKM